MSAPELDEAWPPEDSERLDADALYDDLAALGFRYGPPSRASRASDRRDDELFAEVALDDDSGDTFGVHPALFDAALHGLALLDEQEAGRLPLPFSFAGVRLHREAPAAVRVRLALAGPSTLELHAYDTDGQPVLSVGGHRASGRSRATSSPRARATSTRCTPSSGARSSCRTPAATELVQVALLGEEAPDDAHVQVERMLGVLQEWLTDERRRDAGARVRPAVLDGERPDPVAAAVRGLVRSAQSEHPGRFLLVDSDSEDVPWGALLGGRRAAGRAARRRRVRARASSRPTHPPPIDTPGPRRARG